MKKVIASIVLLVAFYFVVTDGMINHFNLEAVHQYAFNYGAIFFVIPFCLFVVLGMEFKEEGRV